jgi:hypothetical protein
MGVLRWLDRIDPLKLEEAARRLVAAPRSRRDVVAFLAAFGRQATDAFLEAFEEQIDGPDPRRVLNQLLERAVTEQSWDLEKSLGGFQQVADHLPALKPLRLIVDFQGLDVGLPAACDGVDTGLFGCLSTAAVRRCAEALTPFPSVKEVCVALRQARTPLARRLFGTRAEATVLASKLDDGYFDHHWKVLRAAVDETLARRHYLGLGMNP